MSKPCSESTTITSNCFGFFFLERFNVYAIGSRFFNIFLSKRLSQVIPWGNGHFPPLFSWWFKILSRVERQTLNIFPLFKHNTNYQCLVASALPSSIKFCRFFYVWSFCKVPNIKTLLRWLDTFCFQLTILRMNNPLPGCGGTHVQS